MRSTGVDYESKSSKATLCSFNSSKANGDEKLLLTILLISSLTFANGRV
jgi:hypothetical protein